MLTELEVDTLKEKPPTAHNRKGHLTQVRTVWTSHSETYNTSHWGKKCLDYPPKVIYGKVKKNQAFHIGNNFTKHLTKKRNWWSERITEV